MDVLYFLLPDILSTVPSVNREEPHASPATPSAKNIAVADTTALASLASADVSCAPAGFFSMLTNQKIFTSAAFSSRDMKGERLNKEAVL
ncbi:hypothetical protein KP509_29G085400 [Ceratopteris richardii]|uniref:Uncharacterized protein n=1 Tax=Ceratopteris richardii TaxID=49495 RepID=A0A8T2R8P2_CERRI|nr:hypothetical protein KP509_29G085400 [Ceratopteris richardii]